MQQQLLKKLPKVARYNMFLNDLLTTFIILGIIYFLSIFVYDFDIVPDLIQENYHYLYYVALTWMTIDAILTQLVGYQRIRYSIDDQSVEVYKGIYFISHEIVPIRRMQQVNINQGPLNRLFNLSSVNVITSGGTVQLAFIKEDESEEIARLLRDRINEFVMNEQPKNIEGKRPRLEENGNE